MNIPDLMTMLKSGVHFGHQVSRRHPKMKPFIFMVKNGFHIIDLEQTQKQMHEAKSFIKSTVESGGKILFLGTKKQARKIVRKHAEDCGMPFITERWLGGTFTNFAAISKLIKNYNDLQAKKEKGEFSKYTKKERLDFDREIERLETIVGGVKDMQKVPEALFVVDIKKEKTAVREAIRRKIPIIALCDTNTNPDLVQYPIAANDDAIKSIELVTDFVASAVKEAKK